MGVSVTLIYYLIKLIDWNLVGNLARSGVIYDLWLGPLILLIGIGVAAERWCLILAFFGITLRWIEAFRMYLIGSFYSVLLPGVLGGDVVRVAICRTKTGGAAATILASVGIERGLGLWGVTMIGTFGAVVVTLQMPVSFDVASLLLSPLMTVGIPLAVWIAYVVANRVGPVNIRTGLIGKSTEIVHQFVGHVRELPSGLATRTLFFSTVFQASEIFIYFYFGHVMKINVPFAFYLFVIPLVYLATVLPISLGGIGVRESVLVWFLNIAGIPASEAVLLAFLVYLNRVVVGAIGGGIQVLYRFGRN